MMAMAMSAWTGLPPTWAIQHLVRPGDLDRSDGLVGNVQGIERGSAKLTARYARDGDGAGSGAKEAKSGALKEVAPVSASAAERA